MPVTNAFRTTAVLFLAALLACTLPASRAGVELQRQASRFPLLSNEETWQRLPTAEKGENQPLPNWARALAASLPHTTAAMLELDYLHRARSPLNAKLRGQMRWVAADANRCAYAKAYAEADLRRAGFNAADMQALRANNNRGSEPERLALEFARKLTLAADTVTDDEMARLIALHGDRQVVAMVLLLAYANFQDRLVLALGLGVEPGGPLPPVEVRFARLPPGEAAPAQPRPKPEQPAAASTPERVEDADWLALDFAALQKEMEGQRARPPRIAVPAWEEVREKMPPGPLRDRNLRIRWSLVCLGYQPELALGWSACLRTFAQESKQDRVFEESLFWVITRATHCFY